jgi:diamine N-acetyltransferase
MIPKKSSIIIKTTTETDLDYITQAEKHPHNVPYVGQWSSEQHRKSFTNPDIAHRTIWVDGQRVGYYILRGLQNPYRSIEFMRLVVTVKGKGYGRQVMQHIKRLAFEQLKAHRLWLDVRADNLLAKELYISEGFIEEGTLRECDKMDGEWVSLTILSILEEEYCSQVL